MAVAQRLAGGERTVMAIGDRARLDENYRKRAPGEIAEVGDYVFNGRRFMPIFPGSAWDGAMVAAGFSRYATVWTRPKVEYKDCEVVWNPRYLTDGKIDWQKVFPKGDA